MQVTINLDADMIEKLEKYREKEIVKVESLIEKYEGVESEDNVERTLYLIGLVENYKKLPMNTLLFRYLM